MSSTREIINQKQANILAVLETVVDARHEFLQEKTGLSNGDYKRQISDLRERCLLAATQTSRGQPLRLYINHAGIKALADHIEHHSYISKTSVMAAPVRINRIGSMLTPFFTDTEVTDYRSATTSDADAYGRFARALLANGIYPPPSQYECWFTGLTHGEDELAATREALARAVDSL